MVVVCAVERESEKRDDMAAADHTLLNFNISKLRVHNNCYWITHPHPLFLLLFGSGGTAVTADAVSVFVAGVVAAASRKR